MTDLHQTCQHGDQTRDIGRRCRHCNHWAFWSHLPTDRIFILSGHSFLFFFFFSQADDDIEWAVLKPEIFGVIMDFFASGLPVLTDERPSGDTGMCLAINVLQVSVKQLTISSHEVEIFFLQL